MPKCVINPRTGRAVLSTGPVGKRILKKKKKKKSKKAAKKGIRFSIARRAVASRKHRAVTAAERAVSIKRKRIARPKLKARRKLKNKAKEKEDWFKVNFNPQ